MNGFRVTFFEGYVTCALWSSTDNRDDSGGMPLGENFGEEDIRPESLASMRADCDDFASSNREMLDIAREAGWDDGRLGHDFWLSRNGHGAGFFDEYFGEDKRLREAFRELQDAARAYGSCDIMPDAEPDENGDFPDGTMLSAS